LKNYIFFYATQRLNIIIGHSVKTECPIIMKRSIFLFLQNNRKLEIPWLWSKLAKML